MTMVPLQFKAGSNGGSGAATTVFTSNVTVGSTIVVIIIAASATATFTVTDDINTLPTYQSLPRVAAPSVTGCFRVYAFPNSVAGGTPTHGTVVVTPNTGFVDVLIVEVPNGHLTSPFDANDGSTYALASGTGTTATSGALTPAVANGLAISFAQNSTLSHAFTPAGGFTVIGDTANYALEAAYLQLSTIGSVTGQFTISPSKTWDCGLFILQPPGGGGGGTHIPPALFNRMVR